MHLLLQLFDCALIASNDMFILENNLLKLLCICSFFEVVAIRCWVIIATSHKIDWQGFNTSIFHRLESDIKFKNFFIFDECLFSDDDKLFP